MIEECACEGWVEPVYVQLHHSHFFTCPAASKFRKR